MQSNLIIKNTVKQRPLYLYLHFIIMYEPVKLACEQGTGGERKGKRKREGKEEPVGIHQYFDCRSFIIYAGPSFNYSNVRSNNHNSKNTLTVA